jgi:hypothetical protein
MSFTNSTLKGSQQSPVTLLRPFRVEKWLVLASQTARQKHALELLVGLKNNQSRPFNFQWWWPNKKSPQQSLTGFVES